MKKLNQFKFKTQLHIYFAGIIMLIAVCIMLTLYMILKNYYYNQESMALNNQAKQAAMNIENKINYYYSYLELLAKDKKLKEILSVGDEGEIKLYFEQLTKDFHEFNLGKLNGINIYKEDNERVKNVILEKNLFQDMEQQAILCTGTYFNKQNEKVFSLCKWIDLPQLNAGYLIELTIYETEIFQLFNKDTSGNLIIISQGQGNIISLTDRRLFNHLLEKEKQIGKQCLPKTNKTIQIAERNSIGWETLIYTDSTYLERGYFKMLNTLVPVVGLVLLIAFLLVSVVSKQLDLRLKLLQEKIASIGSQDFYKHIQMEGEDEFTVLSEEVDKARIQIYHLLEEVRAAGREQRMSNMIALRAQINSHFLFNALASIKWLSRQEENGLKVSCAIDQLAAFLRYSIALDENQVLVRREVEQLNAYIYLQKLRCGNEFNVSVDIEEELMERKTVKLILQPIVENAFFHGRKADGSILNIMIYSYYEELYYYLVVEDDGRGINRKRIAAVANGEVESRQSGYGLKNVMKRIDICTGGEGELTIESEENSYTKVTVKQKK